MGPMERRHFLIATGVLLAAPRSTRAQEPGRTYRVGVLFGAGAEGLKLYRSALSERLATHGFTLGENLRIEYRFSRGGYSFGEDPASELLALKPDAVLTLLNQATQAAQTATRTVPIIFVWVADPVATGLVQSYGHPGGNITGATNRFFELAAKRLDLARELLPNLKRVAVPYVVSPNYERVELRKIAKQLGIGLTEFHLVAPQNGIVEYAVSDGADVIIPFVQFTALGYTAHGEQLVRAALEHRMPVIFAGREMVELGGLMSYGTNLVDDVRRGADMLARVLKGEKPANLPVDQAARFELAVNLKTAKAIGITIPQSILLRADRVIE